MARADCIPSTTSTSSTAPSTPSRTSPFCNVNEGEIVALIGANGAGKSTTLKTVSGLLRSKTGSIRSLWARTLPIRPLISWLVGGLAQVPEDVAPFADDGRGEPGDGRLHESPSPRWPLA